MVRFLLAFDIVQLKIPFLIGEWSVRMVGVPHMSGLHVGVLVFVYAELVRIDLVNRRNVGTERKLGRSKQSKSKTPGAKGWRLGHPH
jgi:hypothetical protein